MRKITSPKAAAKPAAKPVASKPAPVASKPAAPAADTTAAKPSRDVTRTASTVAALQTNYATFSDRDTAYLSFFASFAKANKSGVVTLADIRASNRKPAYNGSNKPYDAGVIVRLTKAGYLKPSGDGASFTFTEAGRSLKAYNA